jgi:hypothetical protein
MKLSQVEREDFNAQAKASMRNFLRSKSWVEKVAAIERMNVATGWQSGRCVRLCTAESTDRGDDAV